MPSRTPGCSATPGGVPEALIVNSLTSVSLLPPLIAFCPSRISLTWARMARVETVGISVLGHHHAVYAARAAAPGADRFGGERWQRGTSGVPILGNALATLECRTVARHSGGDHWIVVGRVEHLRIGEFGDPLAFFDGAFGTVQPGPAS